MRMQSSFSGVRVQDLCQSRPPPEDSWMLVDSRMSPSMCCSEWCFGEITGLHLPQHAKVPQRTHFFHRVVRRCQNQFWSDWQENLTSLSRVNPELQPPSDVQWSVKT